MNLKEITDALVEEVEELSFGPPVTHVYNPLVYARRSHDAYLERYGRPPRPMLLVGMNPGPFGMAQTGVPFGDVDMVREWLGIEEQVDRPEEEHPKRPVKGFACCRNEVSGSRLWGWARDRFATPERFFERFYVHNYCPLCFMEESGRNRTPDKLPKHEREPLFGACDRALQRVADHFKPDRAIAVGKFAEDRLRSALDGKCVEIGRIPHPSPANPNANKNWAGATESALRDIGVELG